MPTSPPRSADAPPGLTDRLPPRHAAWLLLITAGGLLLRLHALDREALWFDEVNTLWRAAGGFPLGVLARTAGDVQAPLFDLLIAALTALTGRTDGWILRLPSALAGAALVPVAFALARRAALTLRWPAPRAANAGLLAALLVACSPFALRYSQEARPYALLALLAGLVVLGALRAVESGGLRGLRLLALTAPLLVLTHYYGVLLLAAVVLFLIVDAGAFGARLPRVVTALLPALAVLLLWAPVAARQFALRDMAAVYHPLDGPMLLEILDAQGPHAALAAAPRPLAARLGSLAGTAGAGRLVGRGLLLLLLLAGAVTVFRRRAEAAGAGGPQPEAASCRAPAIGLGLLALLAAVAALLPSTPFESVAAALFKGARVLDAENLAFVQQIRAALWPAAGGLLWLALLVALLPRWAGSAGRGRYPARLLAFALIVPLMLTAALDATGKHTLAARNMILLAPSCVALTALGVVSLPRAARWSALVLLAALTGLSFRVLPAYTAKADWRAAGAAIAESDAEPVCWPAWLARCVEYHAHRPWDSVLRAGSLAEIERLAASHPRLVLVEAQEAEASVADDAELQAALAARFGKPKVERFRGVTCSFYERR